MTRERADEIVRKVIYARLSVMPKMKDSEDAFQVGRMVGQIQRQLEVELSLEVDKEEYEVVNLGNGLFEKRYKVESEDKKMKTYGDIYNEFRDKFPLVEVEDYRPAVEMHVPQLSKGIPNAIIVWLKDGTKVIYIAESEE